MSSIVIAPAPDMAAVGRSIVAALRDHERRAWETRWRELTGRPWGWQPPVHPRLSVHLGVQPHGEDVRVMVGDLPLQGIVSGVTVDRRPSDRGPGNLVLTIPMAFVDLV